MILGSNLSGRSRGGSLGKDEPPSCSICGPFSYLTETEVSFAKPLSKAATVHTYIATGSYATRDRRLCRVYASSTDVKLFVGASLIWCCYPPAFFTVPGHNRA